MRFPLTLLLLLAAAVLTQGCSGDVGGAGPTTSGITLSIVPAAATTSRGGEVDFQASVSGDSSLQGAGFSWSVEELNGGSVDGSGRYIAPQTSGTFHVVVTSNADPSKQARATVTVESTVVVSVSPKSANVVVGASASFTASVTGINPGESTAVTWSVKEQGGGTIDGSGTYVAPGTTGTFHVVATSVADPSRADTATVVVGAAPVIAVNIIPSNASTTTGGSLTFTATVTGTTAGQSTAVTWSVQESGGGTVDGSGHYTAPRTAGTFHLRATSVADPSKSATATISVTATPVVAVSISPGTATIRVGGTVAFTATVTGTTAGQSTAVTWSVQESGGGTVDSSGHYTAPGTAGTFHVVATSVADTSKKASATVTVIPNIAVSIAPPTATTNAGGTVAFTATVTGTTAGQSTAVTWSVQESGGGTVDSGGHYTAPGAAGTFHVVATSVADTSKQAVATVTVTPPIAVSISPPTASTTTGGTVTFTATVTGTTSGQSTAVTWSVQEGAAGGTIDGAGHYTAPGSAGTYHVVATSVADPSKSATATVSVTQPPQISVTVSPATASVSTGGTFTFTATVTGTTSGQSTAVTWSVQEGAAGGTIDGAGHYTAPGSAGTYHVVATSVANPSKSGSATVTVTTSSGVLIPVDRTTAWNPGILSDGQLGLPLGADGIPQRTTVCATLSPGADIQAAINACPAGQVVQLNAGTFSVSSPVTLTKGVVLRGAGYQGAPSGTTIAKSGGGTVIAIGTGRDSTCYGGTAYNLTQDGAKEGTTLSVGSAASNFTAGDLALVDVVDDSTIQQGDCTFYKRVSGRSAAQRVEIKSVDTASGTLTLSSLLHWKFPAGSPYLAQVTKAAGTTPTKWAGIEHLRIQGGSNTSYNGAMAGGIDISNAAYCWVKDVQTDGTIGGMHVSLTGTYRCVVRDSFIHHSANYGFGTDCYGIVLRCSSADNLIENNIVRWMNKPILFNNSGGGNVVAYNYADNSWATPPAWQETNIDCHCSFPHMELVEGNYAPHVGAGSTHGNAGYLTYFRNYSSSYFAPPAVVGSTVTQYQRVTAIQFDGGDIDMNVVGNVLGMAGVSTVYETYDVNPLAIYQLAVGGSGATDVAVTSLYRTGNFDTVHNATVWDASGSRTLPPSLYLQAKPGWWPSGTPWPWAGPDLSPMVGTLPAKARSDSNP